MQNKIDWSNSAFVKKKSYNVPNFLNEESIDLLIDYTHNTVDNMFVCITAFSSKEASYVHILDCTFSDSVLVGKMKSLSIKKKSFVKRFV